MKLMKLGFVLLGVLILLSPVLLAVSLLEKRPVATSKAVEVEHASQVKSLVKRVFNAHRIKAGGQFFATDQELNALVAFANKNYQGVRGKIAISPEGLTLFLTKKMPDIPLIQALGGREGGHFFELPYPSAAFGKWV